MSQHFPQLHGRVGLPSLALWAAVTGGVVCRVAQYAFDRSLWLDESFLALNIRQRSFVQLTQLLDLNQAAPIGFLWVQKVVTRGWGDGEYALRAAPFVAGIAALVLFAVVARRMLSPVGAAVAAGLFAVSDTLIYYAAEVKQYSTDVLVAVIVLYVATEILRADRPTPVSLLIWSLVGAIAVWFSHPAVFTLAGVGGAMLLAPLWRRDGSKARRLALVGAVWAMSFGVSYWLLLRPLSANQALQVYWQDGYPSLRPSWLLSTFFGVFDDPAGLSQTGVAAAAFLIGCGALFTNRRAELASLLFPLACTLAASALRLYPFSGRLLLFLVPCLLLLVAAGSQFIVDLAGRQRAQWAGVVFMVVLFVQPAYVASYHLFTPRTKEEIKPVLSYLRSHAQPDDVLYVDWPSQYPLQYYADRYRLNVGRVVSGVASNDWADRIHDLRQLRGARVWILFSHLGSEETRQGRDQLLAGLLNEWGKQLDSYTSPGAGVYLYDLSDEPAQTGLVER